jgi:glutamyl-tRNA synthetase
LPVILNKDDGKKMGKRDRDKKIRQQAQNWMKNTKKTVDDLAAACGLAPSRISTWINDTQQQLDLSEQKQVMSIVGLKESDLPEILVHDFRRNGYFPQALLNFLALLGWNPGGDRERMSMEELVQLFGLEGVNKSGARFDREKLLAFNTEAGAALPPDRLVATMRDYLKVNSESSLNKASDEQLAAILKMKSGFRTLRDVDESSRFLFLADEQIAYDPQAVEKVLRKQNGIAVLKDLQPILEGISDWNSAALEKSIEVYCQEKQLGLGKVAQPIRVAVSGGTISPPIFQSLEFLGKEHALARIARCLAATQ